MFLGWYARVYFILPERPVLTKRLVIVFSFVLFAFGMFAVVSGLKALDWVIRRTSFLTLAGLVVLSAIFTILKPEHMFSSLEGIVWNTLVKGNWGLTWYILVFLLAELYFSKRRSTEYHWLFMVLVTYVVVVYDLAYFSDPYHIGEFDSANRLLLQVLPLIVLYLGTGFVSLPLSSIRERGRTSTVEVAL